MRAVLVTLLGGLVACAPSTCPTDQVLQDDGSCADVVETDETDDTDESDDTDEAEPTVSLVTLEIDVTVLPSDNVITLTCGGRTLLTQDLFTFFTTLSETFEVPVGDTCTVDVADSRGGLLLAGRLFVCSVEAASWEAERGLEKRVAEVVPVGCVPGCPDPVAENYNAATNLDDGTCEYILGCDDERALNYDPLATKDDGSCDFGGFGPIAVTTYLDGSPTDNIIRLVCDGTEAMAIGADTTPNPWSVITRRTVVDAGYDCEIIVEDDVGDEGPSGFVEACGDVVLTWERTPALDSAYKISIGSFFSPACSGCTDPVAPNFDPDAVIEDGTCVSAP